MKNLLYVGNYLRSNKSNVSYMHILGNLLKGEGFNVVFTSNKSSKPLRLLDMIIAFFKNKKSVDYILIDTYSTYNFYYAYAIATLSKFYNKKYITLLHGGNLPERLDKSPTLSKKIFNNAYVNVSPSLYLKDRFEKKGYSNIKHIANTLELKNYSFLKRDYSKVMLLWVRSFSKIYNPKMAISVLKLLLDIGYNAELCMVGPDSDGSMKDVMDYAKSLNVNVNFTGKLTKEAWISLSNNYNIFINTTQFDNTPVSVIEAMALGLTVISTNVGGMPYLIDNNIEGILVAPDCPEDMASAIIKLVNNNELSHKLASNARKKVEQFDWQLVKRQWLDILQ